VGIDAAILMNPQVWVASGHVVNFNDPLIDCKACKMRFRADQLVEAYNKEHGIEMVADGLSNDGDGYSGKRGSLAPAAERTNLPISQLQYDV
jgi:glycyl-tRNA synthetase (class II)